MKCGRYARALPRCWWSGAWRGCDELTTLRRVGAGAASAGAGCRRGQQADGLPGVSEGGAFGRVTGGACQLVGLSICWEVGERGFRGCGV